MASHDDYNKNKEFSASHITLMDGPCDFCRRDVDDELIYGKCYVIGHIQCHYNCVNLSSNLKQRGDYDEGLFGYLYDDMLEEIESSENNVCSYCNEGGATLHCAVAKCGNHLHFPCGKERHAVFMTYGIHRLYCQGHAPNPNAVIKRRPKKKNASKLRKGGSRVNKKKKSLVDFTLSVKMVKEIRTGRKSKFVSEKKRVKRTVEPAPDRKTRSSTQHNVNKAEILEEDYEVLERDDDCSTQRNVVNKAEILEEEYEVLEREDDCNILILKM